MARLGKLVIKVPGSTKIVLKARFCVIQGPFGSLVQLIPQTLSLKVTEKGLVVTSLTCLTIEISKQLGLVTKLLKNSILGVNSLFEKNLQLVGVGYRAKLDCDKLFLFVGYSHPTFLKIPVNLTVTITNNSLIKIIGSDKQVVCLFASQIRQLKPPEPYKGKGIKYRTEIIKRKIGKSNKM